MLEFLFAFPYHSDKVDPNNYSKKQIIDKIEYNYSIDKNRNVWDKNFINGSDYITLIVIGIIKIF